MFKWLERITSNHTGAQKPSSSAFEFKDTEALFRLQCQYGDTRLEPGKSTFAVVVDAAKTWGVPSAVKMNDDGTQTVVLKVASEDGGFLVLAYTQIRNKPLLKPGDPVLWVPKIHNKEIGTQMGDQRSGWVGFIGAKVSMTVGTTNSWEIIEKYG